MGGRVFDGTTDFDHNAIDELLDLVNNKILKSTGIECIPVGSAATPTPGKRSGDLDVIVDEKSVDAYFNTNNARDAKQALSKYIQSNGFETSVIGTNVHVKMPLGSEHHQLDIMVVKDAGTVSQFHKHDIPQGSQYKGIHKQLAIAKIAKAKGLLWSAWKGLFVRNPNGKAGEFVSSDLDQIAKVLLGDNKTANDLGSLETILASLPKDQADALMAELQQDRNWKVSESAELTRIKELAGMTLNSVRMVC